MTLNIAALSQAANEARGLAMDAVHKCASGHLGLPLGCAEIGAVLWGHALRYNPNEPKWLNRDRFILSAGHGSMFLYSWLHLAGYPQLDVKQVENFRALGSHTPGHPEFHETLGVEATTGPLGQGVANAVGYAVSQKMAAAKYNTKDHTIFDSHIIALAGDGCMQEGVAMEAIAFAGHFKLDNLILIYDSNDVTLDAMAKETQSEDAARRFEAIEWSVQTIDGNDMQAFLHALERAKVGTGKPHLIIAKTIIGQGIPEVAGTAKAHGEGGAKFVDAARKGLGLPENEHFFVSKGTREFFVEHGKQLTADYEAWSKTYQAWIKANPELAKELDASVKNEVPADLLSRIPQFAADAKIATRKAGSDVLQAVAKAVPSLIGGSADLYGSTLNYINDGKDFNAGNPSGRNIRFGIREHGMCGILNGLAYDGIFRPSGATFLVFADYCRPSIRLASLSGLGVIYIFTHDSVGVGEDGPTHQPVETVSGLRVIPNLDVIRPADPEETAGAFAAALQRTNGPTLLSLTRQVLPNLNEVPVQTRREGVLKGAYVAVKETGALKTILLSAGSEVQHAVAAAKQLGEGVRVVSVPSFHRFDAQPQAYKDEVLPPSCRRRVAIEAGVTGLWYKYVGLDGKVIGIDRFGLSAPGGKVMEVLGMTAQSVVDAVKSL
ncbi:transketolase [Chthoniobacter flavus Ellin428]|uniref:Transketolase n=1 Tax=Chthoniobacter flavus Ellin428 TaxID=497964 RepID=B4D6P4_9BACT|nr:transketolase [Chthoniobacter flavus]EDY17845.1 transketolase [Chthoniobacter flavus Ellin428]TCO88457.1 transketolase [Chthoniobacter flavus]